MKAQTSGYLNLIEIINSYRQRFKKRASASFFIGEGLFAITSEDYEHNEFAEVGTGSCGGYMFSTGADQSKEWKVHNWLYNYLPKLESILYFSSNNEDLNGPAPFYIAQEVIEDIGFELHKHQVVTLDNGSVLILIASKK